MIGYGDDELINIFNRMGNLEAGKDMVRRVGRLLVDTPTVLLEHQRDKLKKSPSKNTMQKYIKKDYMNRWYDDYIASLAMLNKTLR